ncbi:MAG: GH3 auxin-responsive promoter family protein [Pirellulaceae bacterium]
MIVRLAYLIAKHQLVRHFRAKAVRAQEVQQRVLLEKIARNATSAFGRDHGFSEIRGVRDFRLRVPISDYDYFRPYVNRVKQGEIRAMFGPGTRVLMMSVTSGTTGEPKYIPITNHFFREYRRGWNLWGLDVFRDHLDLVRKTTLQFSSDWHESQTEAGIPCGSVSGLAAETRPLIARLVFILPAVLNKIEHTRDKQYVTLRITLHRRDVGMLVTANPLTLLNLARLADAEKESLIRDVHDGTLSAQVDIPGDVRHKLRRRLFSPDVRAARRLEEIVAKSGHLHPRDFWPNVTVLSVWTGGTMGCYLDRLRELYGDVAFRDHGLSASEGRMTLPFGDGARAGYLDYPTHYFEFIPVDQRDKADPVVLEAHELIPGEAYYILLTTSSGLYRYDIHDVVRCVDYEGTCPLLEFLNKGAHFSSLAGEKLSENQVVHAVGRALQNIGLRLEHFMLVPEFGDPGRYHLLVEGPLDARSRESLAAGVDTHLARVNCEYKERLDSHRLDRVRVTEVPTGTWDLLRTERLARHGGSFEQYKHPFLLGDTEFVQRITSLTFRPPEAIAVPHS